MRRDRPRHLARDGLDLDHARTEIAENLARIGPGEELGEIEDEKPRQRALGASARNARGRGHDACPVSDARIPLVSSPVQAGDPVTTDL